MSISYFFAVLRASFHSKDFYRAVGQHWKGYGLGYLAGAIVLSWAIIITSWMATISAIDLTGADKEEAAIVESDSSSKKLSISDKIRGIIDQIPLITVEKGEVAISEAQPYTITIPGTDVPFAIIDTTGKVTSLKDSKAAVLVTKNQVVTIFFDAEDVTNFMNSDSIVIDRPMIIEWVGLMKKSLMWYLPLVIFPFMVIMSLAYTLFRTLFYAGIGFVFSRIQAINLPFPVIFRLAVMSAIPVTLISTVPGLFPFRMLIPYQGLVLFVIGIGYLLYAIHVNQDTPEAETSLPEEDTRAE